MTADTFDPTLVVVPTDPLSAYLDKGLGRLSDYYNPLGRFDAVEYVSPFWSERDVDGLSTRRVSPDRLRRDLGTAPTSHVVRAYGGDWPAVYAALATPAETPLAISLHDTAPERFSDGIRFADLVICVSSAVRDLAVEHGVDPDRTALLPNAIRDHFFDDVGRSPLRETLRSRIADRPYLVHVGRYSPQKNLDTVIAALAVAPADVALVSVGAGDDTEYRRIAADAGVDDRCVFAGSLPSEELATLMAESLAMCTPSRWEGFGNVFIEAAATGTPVIAPAIGPVLESLGDDGALFVRDLDDPREIAAAIDRVRRGDDRVELGAAGRRRAERYRWQNVKATEVELYRALLDDRDGAPHRERPSGRDRLALTARLGTVGARRLVGGFRRRIRDVVRELRELRERGRR